MAKRSVKATLVYGLVFGVPLGIGVGMLGDPVDKTPEQLAADKLMMAMIRCENQAEIQIADPEGFDPETYGQWLAEDFGENHYTFRFKARAKNVYGALVWGNFRCEATYEGGHWTAEISLAEGG